MSQQQADGRIKVVLDRAARPAERGSKTAAGDERNPVDTPRPVGEGGDITMQTEGGAQCQSTRPIS
ncbi:hypothetical protein [Leucobacter triazinivorans]|nr:hypothetical protein [Leucobacter triazinivorans]